MLFYTSGGRYKHLPFLVIYYFYLEHSRGHRAQTNDISDNKTNRPIKEHYLPGGSMQIFDFFISLWLPFKESKSIIGAFNAH